MTPEGREAHSSSRDEREADARRRIAELTERLVNTAHALHFAAADAAAVLADSARTRRPPTSVDANLLAKRWTEVSERAAEVARAWAHDVGDNVEHLPLAYATGQDLQRPPVPADIADLAIEHMFRAGVAAQRTWAESAGPGRHRLEQVADEIDEAIADLRSVLLDARREADQLPPS